MYLAVLGRQPEISIAELEAVLGESCQLFLPHPRKAAGGGHPGESSPAYVTFSSNLPIDINRLGGTMKLAQKIKEKPLEYLAKLPEGKITFGISDYSKNASRKTATLEALKLKKILIRHGRSVRAVENRDAVLSTATSLHNGLSGKNERKIEFIKINNDWYRVIGVQDIDAYAKRDQARPARDARVGMLPPKLAQILINLCGPLKTDSTILDPFCGTGVVLQEAILMGYQAYGTDINEKMVEYTDKNLKWLLESGKYSFRGSPEPGKARQSRLPRRAGQTQPEKEYFQIQKGDATNFEWQQPIDAVACEGYLGQPMSQIPSELKLKEQMQACGSIILGFLKNLVSQIQPNTPVVIAIPAWLRSDGAYSRLKVIDEINDMGYNVDNKSREGLLYCREGQIVARDIIILRKK